MGAGLIGLDAAVRALGTLPFGQGRGSGGGAGGPDAFGYKWGPETESLLLRALAEGHPATEAPRTPGEGLFSYGLSKLGLLNPTIQANPDQIELQKLMLKQQATQQAQDVGGIYETAGKIAAGMGGKPAQQFYEQEQKLMPQGMLAKIDPSVFQGIYSKAQLQAQQEQLRAQHEQAWEQYQQTQERIHDQMATIAQQRADAAEAAANARSTAELASANATQRRLDQVDQRLQQQAQEADRRGQISLLTSLIHDPNPDVQAMGLAALRKMAPGLNFQMPPAEAAAAGPPSSFSFGGLFGHPAAAGTTKPLATPWSP